MTTESGRPSAEEWRSVDGGLLSERAHIVKLMLCPWYVYLISDRKNVSALKFSDSVQ